MIRIYPSSNWRWKKWLHFHRHLHLNLIISRNQVLYYSFLGYFLIIVFLHLLDVWNDCIFYTCAKVFEKVSVRSTVRKKKYGPQTKSVFLPFLPRCARFTKEVSKRVHKPWVVRSTRKTSVEKRTVHCTVRTTEKKGRALPTKWQRAKRERLGLIKYQLKKLE